ncbi:MAG: hypothetical protein Q7T25_14820 [Sideroxyarcus sp.]|nr:hypothetical protein [Sideroxyarcus sp.]
MKVHYIRRTDDAEDPTGIIPTGIDDNWCADMAVSTWATKSSMPTVSTHAVIIADMGVVMCWDPFIFSLG